MSTEMQPETTSNDSPEAERLGSDATMIERTAAVKAKLVSMGVDIGDREDFEVPKRDAGQAGSGEAADRPAPKTKLDELTERRSKERARLKTKREGDRSRQQEQAQRQAEQQAFAQRLHAIDQMQAQVQERLKALDPNDPVVLKRVLEALGSESVSKFIVGAEDWRPKTPATVEVPRSAEADARVQRLEERLAAYESHASRERNEAAFRSRIEEVGAFESSDGGAPLSAGLMADDPREAMRLAYDVMSGLINEGRRGFDDDDIIVEMEKRLSRYAGLGTKRLQSQKPSATADKTRHQPSEDDEDADAPAMKPKATRSIVRPEPLSKREEYARRTRDAKRVMASFYKR